MAFRVHQWSGLRGQKFRLGGIVAGGIDRLKAYVRANPLAQKAIISAGLHLTLIVGLLVGSIVSYRVLAPRAFSPFDLQSIGMPGPAGGVAAAAASRPEDGLEIAKRKPVKKKVATRKPSVKKPASTRTKKLSKSQIQKLLGSAVKNVGSGSAAAGHSGTGSGGVYDPFGWYYAKVRAVMYEAWQQPSALAGQKGLITRVLIRVQRDGRITRRSLVQPSGNALMDASVMNAVKSVQRIQELPPGFGGAYKAITIDFELTETLPGE